VDVFFMENFDLPPTWLICRCVTCISMYVYYIGDFMIVIGGYDKNWLNDFHTFNLGTREWSTISSAALGPEHRGMEGREGHTATLIRDEVFIIGGCQFLGEG
jgi:hypothetical protein